MRFESLEESILSYRIEGFNKWVYRIYHQSPHIEMVYYLKDQVEDQFRISCFNHVKVKAHDIREIRPDIPIIMCSGFFNKKDDKFLDAEYDIEGLIDETVSKPFEIKPMSMMIRQVLDRRNPGEKDG